MLTALLIAIAPAGLALAAVTDIAERRISNKLTIALALAYPLVALALGLGVGEIAQSAMIGLGLLAFGFALFALNVFGGGDAKLIAAVGPWMGLSAFPEFLFFTALSGGVLALAALCARSLEAQLAAPRAQWISRIFPKNTELPYGVAIAAGGILAYPQSALVMRVFGA